MFNNLLAIHHYFMSGRIGIGKSHQYAPVGTSLALALSPRTAQQDFEIQYF